MGLGRHPKKQNYPSPAPSIKAPQLSKSLPVQPPHSPPKPQPSEEDRPNEPPQCLQSNWQSVCCN